MQINIRIFNVSVDRFSKGNISRKVKIKDFLKIKGFLKIKLCVLHVHLFPGPDAAREEIVGWLLLWIMIQMKRMSSNLKGKKLKTQIPFKFRKWFTVGTIPLDLTPI